MILSGTILKNAMEKYHRIQRRNKRNPSSYTKATESFSHITVIITGIFFIMELIVLFYAVSSAISCSKGGGERIVNFILATCFTLPYMMLNLLFNKCTKATLRGENGLIPSGNLSV